MSTQLHKLINLYTYKQDLDQTSEQETWLAQVQCIYAPMRTSESSSVSDMQLLSQERASF
jgi:hypothetical protein